MFLAIFWQRESCKVCFLMYFGQSDALCKMTWFDSSVVLIRDWVGLLAACWGLRKEENLIYIPPWAPKCLALALSAVFFLFSLCLCTFKFWDLVTFEYLIGDGSLPETAGVVLQSHRQWLWSRRVILIGVSDNFFCQIRFCEQINSQILSLFSLTLCIHTYMPKKPF